MDLNVLKQQLNSYYIQTNRYEFNRFDENGQVFIKIVAKEDNFSVVFNNILLYYGLFSDCTLPDVKPLTLLKIVTEIANVRRKYTVKTLSIENIAVNGYNCLDDVLYKLYENDKCVKMSFAYYLYRTDELLSYVLFSLVKKNDETFSILTSTALVDYNLNKTHTTRKVFFAGLDKIKHNPVDKLKKFINPDYLLPLAVTENMEFTSLYRKHVLDKLMKTL